MPDIDHSTLLHFPYLAREFMTDANLAEYRRIKALGHVCYVRSSHLPAAERIDGGVRYLGGGPILPGTTYEMIDGGVKETA